MNFQGFLYEPLCAGDIYADNSAERVMSEGKTEMKKEQCIVEVRERECRWRFKWRGGVIEWQNVIPVPFYVTCLEVVWLVWARIFMHEKTLSVGRN
jgi:hypothetical protein